MFAGNYFTGNYFAPRYFPRNGAAVAAIPFGGWPRGPERGPDELWSYQKKLIEEITRELEAEQEAPPPVFDEAKAKNIAIIRQLRAEMEATENTNRRRELRRQIEEARKEKDRLFALDAQRDEDDAEYILFN